jgi:hypothetical protein
MQNCFLVEIGSEISTKPTANRLMNRGRDKVKPLSFRTVFRHQSSGNATGNCASAPGNARSR